jgi:hypothetical protein
MDIGLIASYLPKIYAGGFTLLAKWKEINQDKRIDWDEYCSFGLAIALVVGDILGKRVPVPESVPSAIAMSAQQTKIATNDAIESDPTVRRYSGSR